MRLKQKQLDENTRKLIEMKEKEIQKLKLEKLDLPANRVKIVSIKTPLKNLK